MVIIDRLSIERQTDKNKSLLWAPTHRSVCHFAVDALRLRVVREKKISRFGISSRSTRPRKYTDIALIVNKMATYLESMQTHFKNNGKTREFAAHSAKVHSVAWSCDGRKLASGSYDKTVNVFHLDRDRLVRGIDWYACSKRTSFRVCFRKVKFSDCNM